MTIQDLSEACGISTAVISRIERNQASPEIETLHKIAKSFDMTATDLLRLAEARTSHKISATSHSTGKFKFQEIRYNNIISLLGTASANDELSRPEIHQDDYEVCWILEGKMQLCVADETHILTPGKAIQFDAILEHTYKALDNSKFLIMHLRKEKRF